MKKLFVFAAALFAAVSCNEAGIEETTTDANADNTAVTIIAKTPSADTKVSVDATGEKWATSWDEGESLYACEDGFMNYKFEMTNYDADEAEFSGGLTKGSNYRFFAPCPEEVVMMGGDKLTLDYSTQKAGLTLNYIITPEAVQFSEVNDAAATPFNIDMVHVGAAIDLQTRFTNVGAEYTLKSISLTSPYIVNASEINLSESVTSENFSASTNYAPIVVTDINASVKEFATEADQVSVKFNVPAPFLIYDEGFDILYTFEDANGGKIEVTSTVNDGEAEFARGTYNTVKAYCDLEGAAPQVELIKDAFTVMTTSITETDADFEVYLNSDDIDLYYVQVTSSLNVNGDPTGYITNNLAGAINQGMPIAADDYYIFGSEVASATASTWEYPKLTKGTEYTIMVVGIDAEGNIISETCAKTFTTKGGGVELSNILISATVDGADATINITPESSDVYYSVGVISVADLVVDFGPDGVNDYITSVVDELFKNGGKPSNWASAGYCQKGNTSKLASVYLDGELAPNTEYYAVTVGFANTNPVTYTTEIKSTFFTTADAGSTGGGDQGGDDTTELFKDAFTLKVTSLTDTNATVNVNVPMTIGTPGAWQYSYFTICGEFESEDAINTELEALLKYYNDEDITLEYVFANPTEHLHMNTGDIDAAIEFGEDLTKGTEYYMAVVSVGYLYDGNTIISEGMFLSEMEYITFTPGEDVSAGGDASSSLDKYSITINSITGDKDALTNANVSVNTTITPNPAAATYMVKVVGEANMGENIAAYMNAQYAQHKKYGDDMTNPNDMYVGKYIYIGEQTFDLKSKIQPYMYPGTTYWIGVIGIDADGNSLGDAEGISFTVPFE